MKDKFWRIISWAILAVITLYTVWVILNIPYVIKMPVGNNGNISNNGCININNLDKFQYAACYSPDIKTIFLTTKRGLSNYSVNKIDISFVDLSSQHYTLSEIPRANGKKYYRIPANKNPGVLTINLNMLESFDHNICENKKVFVGYCPVGTGGENLNVSISRINGIGFGDFIMINKSYNSNSDSIAMNLADKEKIWSSGCKSKWSCNDWGACENGKQRRDCKDLNSCIISVDSPHKVKRCNETCIENWKCKWSGCHNGVTSPTCYDANKCNTSYSLPGELSCKNDRTCTPNIVCGNWTKCDINYNFLDLHRKNRLITSDGTHSRLCVDKNNCVANKRESGKCSMSVDIRTKIFKRCGENYLDVYNAMSNKTIAVLTEGMRKNNYLNIYFDNQNNIPCDYCFDGKMDGDETGVDCGGSCKKCATFVETKISWWDFYSKLKYMILGFNSLR